RANCALSLNRWPYGAINAAEAVRHALGAVSFEMSVDLILVDGGVLLAKKGQDASGTGFTNLEATRKDCLDMVVTVYADDRSLKTRQMAPGDVVEGVKAIS